jgi:Flp pilus assembly protein TadG
MDKHLLKYGRRRTRCGSAAVETAVVLPFLMVLTVGTIDMGRVSYAAVYVTSAAANGAQYGSRNIASANDATAVSNAALLDNQGYSTTALSKLTRVYNFTSTNPKVTSTVSHDAFGNNFIRVTVTYAFPTLLKYPGVPQSVAMTSSVSMPVLP